MRVLTHWEKLRKKHWKTLVEKLISCKATNLFPEILTGKFSNFQLFSQNQKINYLRFVPAENVYYENSKMDLKVVWSNLRWNQLKQHYSIIALRLVRSSSEWDPDNSSMQILGKIEQNQMFYLLFLKQKMKKGSFGLIFHSGSHYFNLI